MVDIAVEKLKEADWNANRADESVMARLRASIRRFGMVQNLVVRPHGETFEVLSGNQRLRLLRELDIKTVPCVVVDVDDAHARLLAEALNHVHGQDDLGLRAELVREVLRAIPEEEVLSILPETLSGLKGLASMGQETMASYLQNWERARAARLRNLQFKLDNEQLQTVEMAIERVLPDARRQSNNPNTRGIALYLICKEFLGKEKQDGK